MGLRSIKHSDGVGGGVFPKYVHSAPMIPLRSSTKLMLNRSMLLGRGCSGSHHKLCPSSSFFTSPSRSSVSLGGVSVQAKCFVCEELPDHREAGREDGEALRYISRYLNPRGV
jgi:hypothetical protein